VMRAAIDRIGTHASEFFHERPQETPGGAVPLPEAQEHASAHGAEAWHRPCPTKEEEDRRDACPTKDEEDRRDACPTKEEEDRRDACPTKDEEDRRDACPTPKGQMYFDLWSANRDQLLRAGLAPQNIHTSSVCTICHNELFPSYRVEGESAGRFAAIIGVHELHE
jgi:hypothetical protein